MNKKLKVMSSVLCGILIVSNLGVTSAYAKSTNVSEKGEQANHMSIGWTPGYAYGYKWI